MKGCCCRFDRNKKGSEIMTQQNHTPNCNMHELLVTYLYGETAPEDSLRFESHLLECATCKQELSAFEGVRQSLQQWQFDEAPDVRLVTAVEPRKSALALIKELLTIMPVWAKGLAMVAAAMFVLAVLGTDIKIGKDGFSYQADILRKQNSSVVASSGGSQVVGEVVQVNLTEKQLEQLRTSLMTEVNARIAESEQLQKDEVKAQLVNFQGQLKDMRSAELVKIAAQIQQHRVKLQTIERDIDRREGLGLTDILFGEATPAKEPAAGKTSGD
jgi:hypothetical protein